MLEKNGALAPFFSAAMTARQAPSAQALSNPRAHGLERAYADDARRATSADGSRSAWVHSSLLSDKQPQTHDTLGPARNPSRPFHGGWSAMPLMAYAPSRPE